MVGTVDGAAAALEAGVIAPGIVAEMTGTSTVMMMPSRERHTDMSLIAIPHALDNLHLLLGAMVASGASLRWYRDQFGADEMHLGARLKLDAYDLLTQQAAQVPVGSEGVIFLPYMMGERSPIWDSHARGVFFGMTLATPKAALIRAILEGVAFGMRHNIEVAQQAGVTVSEVRSVGGGSQSALWNQIKADVLGLPVKLPATSVGAPFGDAILAGLGVGVYKNAAQVIQEAVHIREQYTPNPDHHAAYSAIYPVFRSLYDHLKPDFEQAAAVFEKLGDDDDDDSR
jgi:xylulokinase